MEEKDVDQEKFLSIYAAFANRVLGDIFLSYKGLCGRCLHGLVYQTEDDSMNENVTSYCGFQTNSVPLPVPSNIRKCTQFTSRSHEGLSSLYDKALFLSKERIKTGF